MCDWPLLIASFEWHKCCWYPHGCFNNFWVPTIGSRFNDHGRELTHWGRDKMVAIFQTTFSNTFSWMKMHEFRLSFHWRLFPRVQLTISQHWFREWLGAGQATLHYLNQWWLVYWHIYASPGFNELRDWWPPGSQYLTTLHVRVRHTVRHTPSRD